MINFHDDAKEIKKQHNPNLPKIPNHPYMIIIIIKGSVSRRKNYYLI